MAFGDRTNGLAVEPKVETEERLGDLVRGRLLGIKEQTKDRKEPDRKTGEKTFTVFSIVLDCGPLGTRWVDAWELADAKKAVAGKAKEDVVTLEVRTQLRAGRLYYQLETGKREQREEEGWIPL